jgi:alpha-methylacyl-CoA racemase
VLEKLGLDPSELLKRNPRLIFVRLTGFRRDGKYKSMAGHDINYLAVSGVLSMLGECGQPPSPPINILGDFAGGGMVAFQGALLALLHRSTSGRGQIVEANMVDGVNFLGTYPRLASKAPLILSGERGKNALDGGAPYYRCYECKDAGRYMSVGALEPQFFAELLKGLGLSIDEIVPGKISREDEAAWPYMREVFTRRFKTKTRKEWEDIFDGTDACCAPVLEMKEMEAAGYDQRPVVGLTESPARPVDMAWNGRTMKPGSGGEEALREWVGWQKGKHFDVQAGVLVLKEQRRL